MLTSKMALFTIFVFLHLIHLTIFLNPPGEITVISFYPIKRVSPFALLKLKALAFIPRTWQSVLTSLNFDPIR